LAVLASELNERTIWEEAHEAYGALEPTAFDGLTTANASLARETILMWLEPDLAEEHLREQAAKAREREWPLVSLYLEEARSEALVRMGELGQGHALWQCEAHRRQCGMRLTPRLQQRKARLGLSA
jgi:hypothetical protein